MSPGVPGELQGHEPFTLLSSRHIAKYISQDEDRLPTTLATLLNDLAIFTFFHLY